jgi:hypothetical protein
MGGIFAKVLKGLIGKKDMRILMVSIINFLIIVFNIVQKLNYRAN